MDFLTGHSMLHFISKDRECKFLFFCETFYLWWNILLDFELNKQGSIFSEPVPCIICSLPDRFHIRSIVISTFQNGKKIIKTPVISDLHGGNHVPERIFFFFFSFLF